MFLPVVQFVTSKPSDVGTLVRISVSSHELGFFQGSSRYSRCSSIVRNSAKQSSLHY